MIRKSKYFFQN